jgi:hypothetical protein
MQNLNRAKDWWFMSLFFVGISFVAQDFLGKLFSLIIAGAFGIVYVFRVKSKLDLAFRVDVQKDRYRFKRDEIILTNLVAIKKMLAKRPQRKKK